MRFRLATLLIAIGLVAIPLGLERKRREQVNASVRQVERLRGDDYI